MHVRTMLAAALVAGAFAAPLHALHAQDTTTTKKAGGVAKVAHDVSATAKKAGRDTKAEVKRDESKSHEALTTAGNETKTTLGNATGVHKVGGDVGKAAQAVSHTGKEAGAKAKQDVKATSSEVHSDLTAAGKKAKGDSAKKP